jgi:hypothetical protein
MSSGVVYLSHGRLFLKKGEGPATAIESKFAQSIRERAFELHRRHAWKSQGRGAKFMSGGALWGADENDPMEMPIRITSSCPGANDGDLYYSLQSLEISGVLLLKNGGATEQRILHTSDFRVGHIAALKGTGRLAMSVQHRGGSTIAVMGSDGSEFAEVTQGESVDESPHWVPNEENRIVFQSAGLAMNQHGQYAGRGPAAIQSLNLDTGTMQCLAEDEKLDFLGPQVGQDGALYFIRRPYRAAQRQFNLLRCLEDVLLFPYRLVYALFQYLNFFTMRYTGKPLSKVGGNAQQRYADMQNMMIWGNLIEARKSLTKSGEEAISLVPSSWELCRKSVDGSLEVLAKGVLSFDLEPGGSVVYSNGTAIYRRTADGQIATLHKDAMIEQVIAVAADVADNPA